jgi:hypothetical protein
MSLINGSSILKLSPPPRKIKLTEQGKGYACIAALSALVFLLAFPAVSCHIFGQSWIGFCLILIGYAAMVCVPILLRIRAETILLKTGEAAVGRIGSITPEARRRCIVTCSFLQGADPVIANFGLGASKCAGKSVGDPVLVLYNPKKPEQRILFDGLMTVQIDLNEV